MDAIITIDSSVFLARVRVDCPSHLIFTGILTAYSITKTLSTDAVETLIASSVYSTTDPTNCPLSTSTFSLVKADGSPNDDRCVSIDS